ncbi:glycoside hydrolase family protein [Bacillus sp. 1NLA3E]|nr:glycoside hydrolase family protein [Bacillus sp. 1NLA3E]
MKIAFFSDTYYPDINGVACTLKRLTDYLHSQNITCKIFAPEDGSNEYAVNHIHRFKSLPFSLYPECRLAFPNPSHIKSELQSFSPDLIHVATPFNLGLCGVYYAKRLNIPLVGSYHTDFDYYLKFYDLHFYLNTFGNTLIGSIDRLKSYSSPQMRQLISSSAVDSQTLNYGLGVLIAAFFIPTMIRN